jgi:hypothetical protein
MKIIKARLRDGVANTGDVSKTITDHDFSMSLEDGLLVVVYKKTGETVIFPPSNVVAMWPEKSKGEPELKQRAGRPKRG